MDVFAWLILILASYLVGSIPTGLLIGRARGVDIREHGSGNVGATNCGRVLGKKYGLLCFALDVLKGLAPVLAAGWWLNVLGRAEAPADGMAPVGVWLAVAVAAVIGHVCPVWLRFKGGKGVATGFGVILGLWPIMSVPALLAGVTWIGLAAWKRYVSLASVAAAGMLPVYLLAATWLLNWSIAYTWPFLLVAVVMAIVVIARHRSNLARLWAGTEPKLGSAVDRS